MKRVSYKHTLMLICLISVTLFSSCFSEARYIGHVSFTGELEIDARFSGDEWETLPSDNKIGSGTHKYYLTADVDLESAYYDIESGDDITLDLNGYSLTNSSSTALFYVNGGCLTIQDTSANHLGFAEDAYLGGAWCTIEQFGGEITMESGTILSKELGIIQYGGTFTLNDGLITTSLEDEVSPTTGDLCVGIMCFGSNGIININGGSIMGFEYGVDSAGDINIRGGTIANNFYGAVDGNFNISGNPVISDNVTSNLVVPNYLKVNLVGELTQGAEIGVTKDGGGQITESEKDAGTYYYLDALDYFFSDDSSYKVVADDEDRCLKLQAV